MNRGGNRGVKLSLLRWLRFASVGSGGLLLQISLIALLHGRLGWHYLLVTALAVECAILHNFLWHRRWTWSDRGPQRTARRLVRFHATVGGVSLGGNLVLMTLFVSALGLPVLPSNLASVACCGVFNYLSCDRWVFRLSTRPTSHPTPS